MLIYFHLNSSGLWSGHCYGISDNVVSLQWKANGTAS